jgi:hypothetical protein
MYVTTMLRCILFKLLSCFVYITENNYDDLTCTSERSDVGVDLSANSGSLLGPDNNLGMIQDIVQ